MWHHCSRHCNDISLSDEYLNDHFVANGFLNQLVKEFCQSVNIGHWSRI